MNVHEEYEQACRTVNSLIDEAKLEGFYRFEAALWEIVRLPFWKNWRAIRIAEKALQVGPFYLHEDIGLFGWFLGTFRNWLPARLRWPR